MDLLDLVEKVAEIKNVEFLRMKEYVTYTL
jgi:hypothetical protein